MKYEINTSKWTRKKLLIFFSIFLLCCSFYIFFENIQSPSPFENETSNEVVAVEKILKDVSYLPHENGNKIYTERRRRLHAHIHPDASFGLETSIQNSIFQGDGQMSHIYNNNGNTRYTVDNILLQQLTMDLENKLENILPEDKITIHRTCVEKESVYNSCDEEGCLQLQLPKSAKSRIKQLVGNQFLRLSEKNKEALEHMGDSVQGYYNIILVTAASGNHYQESKALLFNLHKNVFPYLNNFTLVYYDIGLSEEQREDISNICQCHLRKFPFSHFPNLPTRLKCYAWKPLIVYAHASHGNLLFWMDASLRFFENPSKLKELLELASLRGLQTGTATNKIPRVTMRSMFHFFGDEPCAYHYYAQCLSGIVILKNEPLIHHAVIEPWAACALKETCICPYKEKDMKEAARCRYIDRSPHSGKFKYAQCHRFDQSALSIIIRKLFLEKSHHIMQRHMVDFLSIKRGDKWEDDSSFNLDTVS